MNIKENREMVKIALESVIRRYALYVQNCLEDNVTPMKFYQWVALNYPTNNHSVIAPWRI